MNKIGTIAGAAIFAVIFVRITIWFSLGTTVPEDLEYLAAAWGAVLGYLLMR